jgi:DHA2 family multidrug resistance protein
MRRFDPRAIAASAFALFAISYFMRAGLTPDSSYLVFVLPQLVQGLAMGMFFVATLAVVFDGLPAQQAAAASGLSNFIRITAAGFATALITTFWDRREALHQSRLADNVTQYAPAYSKPWRRCISFGMSDQAAAGA